MKNATLNEQRNFIYEQRDAILADENLKERVLTTAEETIEDFIEEYNNDSKKRDNSAFSELQEKLKSVFNIVLPSDIDKSNLKDTILDMMKKDIQEKENLAGKENLNMFIRYQYVQEIDKKWLDHLEVLEGLREAVHLRSYGSKNPLTEYKIDGFNIFYDMLDKIRIDIASRVFRVKVQSGEEAHQRRVGSQRQMNAQHNAYGAFDGNSAMARAASSPMAAKSRGESVTVVRTAPKVGRNDPCPCGSGKKYKQCCGR